VALGDVNGDGKLDLVTANEGSNTVTVLLGNGDGTFASAAGSPVAVGSFPYSMTVGDMNGDGKLDVATVNSGSNNVTVLLGNGDGTFMPAAGNPVVGANSVFAALGDLNGDGKLDLVTVNYGANSVTVLLGNGNGTFTAAAGSPVTVAFAPNSVAVGDVNGDGKLDLVVTNGDSNTLTVLLGNGDGTFTAASGSPVPVGSGPHSVALGDIDGDGKLDLVVANSLSNNVTVLLNQVPAVPTPPTNMTARPVSLSEIDLSWADNATNEDGFHIERCTGPACTAFTQLATVGPNVTAYANTGLTAGTNYTYRVQAYNAGGNSGYSNTAPSTTPFLLQNGIAVSNVAAAAGSELYFAIQVPSGQAQLMVKISGGTGNADLYLRFGGVPTLSIWDCRPFTAGNSEQCSFSNPVPGDWYVVLQAFAAFSGVSLTAAYASVPISPTNLTANVVSSSQIDLSWTDNATNEDGFHIERCMGAGCTTFQEIAAVGPNVTGYGDVGLTAGTSYSYRVTAYNGSGNSPYSSAVTAVTFMSIIGGTYFVRDVGFYGTAFLFNPIVPSGAIPYTDVYGPSGWNAGSPARCTTDFWPSGMATDRRVCWYDVLPVTGQFTAAASAGSQPLSASFFVDGSSYLEPPTIVGVTVLPTQVTVQWTALPQTGSFLVRLNPYPFTGVTSEVVVSGGTRSATLSGFSLATGTQYQVVVWGFGKDVNTPGDMDGQFNISAHSTIFTAP